MLPTPLLTAAALLLSASIEAGPVATRQASFANCLSDAGLAPVTSDSSNYDSLSAAYNQRLQPSPAALVTPSTISDISSAIKCASAAGVPISAKSGGHSYASYGLGGVEEEALIIELSNFKNITVDDDGTAKIGAGNRLGDVALALNEKGRGLPHGTCPYVGIGGHASYGGYGYASRMWGLTVDTVIGFDAVLANGTVVENVTKDSEPDLYWALAGAAPSYALVTSFYFSTFATPSNSIVFSYSYYGLSVADQSSIFLAFQSWGAEAAPELGVSFIVGTGGSIQFYGAMYSDRQTYDAEIKKLLDQVPGGYDESVQELSWIDSLSAVGGDLDTSNAADSRDSFFAKSLMSPEDTPITEEAITAFFQYLADTDTDTNWFVEVDLYGGNGSAINSVSLDDNSFGRRNSLLVWQLYASSSTYGNPYPEFGVTYVQAMYGALVSPMLDSWNTTYGAYINYVDPTLTDDQVKDLYWGTQYDRLSTLRTKYDPQQVFKNAQSIVPA
ncbi:glucooligosaccharide oxidase [Leucosporidium creatinivorum]|uniref:Glucooligosaccharide oxidase n=1 Tax=Leucosporidium creatinivorum TaxID=106004 RepID=A0A1Y2FIY0_9BASI|nr:glucooligosaccharide oxidase [Leucosporidium creatinivorum]